MTREEAKTYLDVIWNRYRAEYEIEKETMEAYHMAIEALDRPKGEWTEEHLTSTNGGTYTVARCSECGCTIGVLSYSSYCPNCGADMRGEE